ncbi:MAG: hypothetical protein EOP09_09170 [Proteobacteria bacterium]|nr:MAG: hypothetical protein EOP09_09170 [Pseudomonadota bacterium]
MSQKLVLLGATGFMGKAVKKILSERKSALKLVSEPGRVSEGDYPSGAVVIDFSLPHYCLEQIEKHRGTGLFWVVGSTGWTESEQARLEEIAQSEWILRSTNFSWAVQSLARVLRELRQTLQPLGFQCSMTEIHHTRKKDAPSGTAKTLAAEWSPEQAIESIREGDTIGIHEIRLETDSEVLTLRHEAKSRELFASGAIDTAERFPSWAQGKNPHGLVELSDVIFS